MKLTIKAFAMLLALTTTATADEFKLRIGSGHPPQLAAIGLADTFFIPEIVKRVKEETGHDLKFVTAWSGTVAKPDGISEAVESGILDIGLTAVNFEQSRLGLLNFGYYLPFTTPDPVLNGKVAMDMLEHVPALQESVDKYGISILSLQVGENYGLILKDRYTDLGSMKGKKVACGASNSFWAEAVGAVCVLAPVSEHYQGLQSGLLDGVMGFASWVVAFRLDEVIENYVIADFGTTIAGAMLMNDVTRAKLPAEVVDIIDEVAAEHAKLVANENVRRDVGSLSVMDGKGVKVMRLTAKEQVKWAEALKDFPATAAADLDNKGLKGTDVFKAYVQALKNAGYEFPVEYPL